jgi:hypothetical protein
MASTSLQAKSYTYIIGIDTGVNTGLAVWSKSEKRFVTIETLAIHAAINFINGFVSLDDKKSKTLIRVEDARQRKWFGERSTEKLQGAGSVKRDCKIWEDFLKDLKADFEMVAPKKGMTKMDAARFKQMTGYTGLTSSHARDAAMLVYGF